MALIVEDGSVVAGANVYVSLVDARAAAIELGVTLPVDDTEAEAALIAGTQYVDGKSYSGSRVSIDQSLDWPRTDAYAHGFLIPDTTIPKAIIEASILAAVSSSTLWTNDNNQQVQTNRVEGAVTQTFFQNSNSDKGSLKVSRADLLLKPYTSNQGALGGFMGVA